jgi:hypothetical protein
MTARLVRTKSRMRFMKTFLDDTDGCHWLGW